MNRRIKISSLIFLLLFMSQACSAILPDTDDELNNQENRSALGSTEGTENSNSHDDILDFDRLDDSPIVADANVASEGLAAQIQNNTESNLTNVEDETDVEMSDTVPTSSEKDEALLTAQKKSIAFSTEEDGTIAEKSVDGSSSTPSDKDRTASADADAKTEVSSTSRGDETESAESKVASNSELDEESAVGPDVGSEGEPDVELDVESAVAPDVEIDVESAVAPDVKLDAESAIEADAELDAESAIEADAEPDAEPDSVPDGESADEPKVDALVEPKVETLDQLDNDRKVDAVVEVDAVDEPKVEAVDQLDNDRTVDAVVEPKVEAVDQLDNDLKVDAVVEPDTESKVNTVAELKAESVAEPDTEPTVDAVVISQAEAVIELDDDIKVDAAVEPDTEPKVNTFAKLKAEAVIGLDIEPKVETVVEGEVDVDPKVHPEVEAEVEPDLNVIISDNITDISTESLGNAYIESAHDKKDESTESPTSRLGSLASHFKQVSEEEKKRYGDISDSGGTVMTEGSASMIDKSADLIQPAVSMTSKRDAEGLRVHSPVLGSESKVDESTTGCDTKGNDEKSVSNEDQDNTMPSGSEPADANTNRLSEMTETEEEERLYGYTAVWGRQQKHNVNKHLLNEVLQRNAATSSSNDVDEMNNVVEDITDPIVSGTASSGTITPDVVEKESTKAPLPKSVNTQFVEGLDDIDKFLEEVEPPDELDVGAAGSSMQEVLIGQGAQILLKRVSIILSRIKQSFGATRIKDFFASRRSADGEFALFTREELVRAVQRFWNGCRAAAGKAEEMWENLFDDEADSLQFEVEASKLDSILNKNRPLPNDRRGDERPYATTSNIGRGPG